MIDSPSDHAMMELGRTDRLVLRAVEPSDRVGIVGMFEAGRTVVRWSPPLTAGTSFDQMVDRWLTEDKSRHVRLVAERLERDGGPRLACIVSLTEIIRGVFQNSFIGWRTHPNLLNRGYCTEAVRMTLRHAFSDTGLQLHRVQASILADNLSSCRVAHKTGFRFEGLARRLLFIREEWRDHLMYAVTSEEFSS